MHLATMMKTIREFEPDVVVVDPLSNIGSAGTTAEAGLLATRLVDFLKSSGITGLFTSLAAPSALDPQTDIGVSSLIDTWLLVRELESNGERNRGLYILKSRGMSHSNQIREFLLTSRGIQLRDVYVGPEGVLAGSSRLAQEARERASATLARQEIERQTRLLLGKRKALEAQVLALRSEFAAEEEELQRQISKARSWQEALGKDQTAMATSRGNGRARAAMPARRASRARRSVEARA
jgi:circadian clock protein KaiC